MSGSLPASTDPRVLALCLDWLHDSLPWPRAPRYGWQANGGSGFATPRGPRSRQAWRQCEQCSGRGETRRGKCANCEGLGGWHYDPMDEKRAPLRSGEDAHPQRDGPAVRFVRLSSDLEPERLADTEPALSRPLAQLVTALAELREADRYQRALIQRVHILRIDGYAHLREPERVVYAAALEHLGELLAPHKFRAPRHMRVKVAGSDVEGGRSASGTFGGHSYP